MSQSLSATLEAPSPARRSLNLPVALAVAAIVLAVAHMPLLMAHLHVLATKPHYEFYPLVFLGAAVLAFRVWDAAPAWTGADPEQRTKILIGLTVLCAVLWALPSWFPDMGLPETLGPLFMVTVVVGRVAWDLARAAAHPAADGRTGGLVLLGVNLVLLTTAIVLNSPWLGMISFWELLAATAYLAGGWPLLRMTLPALIFLLLLVPPPLNLDGKLVLNLQNLTSRISSKILDRAGVLHFMEGNSFSIGQKSYFVDKACSGINSLFSTLAVTLFCVLFFGAHWLRVIFLILAAIFWVVMANVTRVTLILWLDHSWNFDLSKDGWNPAEGCYYQHSILGFILFGVVLGLMYSTNQFLRFLGTAVRWGDAVPIQADDPSIAADATPAQPLRWSWLAPAFAAYGVLLLFQLGEMQLGAAVTESSLVKHYNTWGVDDMPAQIGGWGRQTDFSFESRDTDNPFGAHSRTWQYKSKSGLSAKVSFDYPFSEWHDLRMCYQSVGWAMPHYDQFTAADGPVKLDCVKFELANSTVLHGYCWFTEFDQTGKPVMVRFPDLSRTYSNIRWNDRLNDIKDRWLSVLGRAKAPPNFYDVLQVQVIVQNAGPLPQEARDSVEKFFVEAAELIRHRCAKGAQGQPSS